MEREKGFFPFVESSEWDLRVSLPTYPGHDVEGSGATNADSWDIPRRDFQKSRGLLVTSSATCRGFGKVRVPEPGWVVDRRQKFLQILSQDFISKPKKDLKIETSSSSLHPETP